MKGLTGRVAIERMVANRDIDGLIAFTKAYAQEAVEQDREQLWLPANSLMRSLSHVVGRAKRGNFATNWEVLDKNLEAELKRQHVFLQPIHAKRAVEIAESLNHE